MMQCKRVLSDVLGQLKNQLTGFPLFFVPQNFRTSQLRPVPPQVFSRLLRTFGQYSHNIFASKTAEMQTKATTLDQLHKSIKYVYVEAKIINNRSETAASMYGKRINFQIMHFENQNCFPKFCWPLKIRNKFQGLSETFQEVWILELNANRM